MQRAQGLALRQASAPAAGLRRRGGAQGGGWEGSGKGQAALAHAPAWPLVLPLAPAALPMTHFSDLHEGDNSVRASCHTLSMHE